MKRAFFLLISVVVFGSAHSQVYVNNHMEDRIVNINKAAGVRIIELVVLEDAIASDNITAAIDYGQARKELRDKVCDKAGNTMKFGSIVSAINHLEGNGWTYVNNSINEKGRGVIYRYYFRRNDQ